MYAEYASGAVYAALNGEVSAAEYADVNGAVYAVVNGAEYAANGIVYADVYAELKRGTIAGFAAAAARKHAKMICEQKH